MTAFTVAYYSSLSDDEVWPTAAAMEQANLSEALKAQLRAFEALSPELRTEEQADAILRDAGVWPSVPNQPAQEPSSEDSEP